MCWRYHKKSKLLFTVVWHFRANKPRVEPKSWDRHYGYGYQKTELTGSQLKVQSRYTAGHREGTKWEICVRKKLTNQRVETGISFSFERRARMRSSGAELAISMAKLMQRPSPLLAREPIRGITSTCLVKLNFVQRNVAYFTVTAPPVDDNCCCYNCCFAWRQDLFD